VRGDWNSFLGNFKRGDALGHLVAEAGRVGQFVEGFQHQALGAVLTELLDLTLFQHTEGLAREVFAEDVFGVEDVAQLVARQAIQVRVVCVELGANCKSVVLSITQSAFTGARISFYKMSSNCGSPSSNSQRLSCASPMAAT